MNIVVHVNKFYDWEPLPDGVKPTEKDIAALRVKPASNGGWLMRVPRQVKTYTSVSLPESEIVATVIATLIRDKRAITRTNAIGSYLQKMIMPHHFHRSWITDIELDDELSDEKLLRSELSKFEAVGLIDNDDIDDAVTMYLRDEGKTGLADDLLTYFGVKKVSE